MDKLEKYEQTAQHADSLTSQDYLDAIHAQSACNLSGIVFSFGRVMKKICREAEVHGHGTEWRNNHPIARLYAEQIMHLSRGTDWTDAIRFAEKHAVCENCSGTFNHETQTIEHHPAC